MRANATKVMYVVDNTHEKVGKKSKVIIVSSRCVRLGAHHMVEIHHKFLS